MKRTSLLVASLATLAAALPMAGAHAYETTGYHKQNGTSSTSTKPRVTYNKPSSSGHTQTTPKYTAPTPQVTHRDDDGDRNFRRGGDDDRGWGHRRWASRDDDRPSPRHHRRYWGWWHAYR